MAETAKPSLPVPPGRRRRRWIAIGGLAVFLCILGLLIWRRARLVYEGPLSALLPQPPVASVTVRDFEGLWRRFEQCRAYTAVEDNADLAALLLADEDWREFLKNRHSPAMRAKLALGRMFLMRAFGREDLLAITPCASRERPALFALTRADFGFLNDVSSLVAQYYPDAHLETSDYRGVTVYLYRARKPESSFSFIHLGTAVVLSLRSPDTAYLHEAVDRWRDAQTRRWRTKEAGAQTRSETRCVLADAIPADTFRSLTRLLPKNMEREFTSEQRLFLERELSKLDRVEARLRADKSVSLEVRLAYSGAGAAELNAAFPPVSVTSDIASNLPNPLALLIRLVHRDPAAAVSYVSNRLNAWPEPALPADKEAKRRRKQAEREKERRKEIDRWLKVFQVFVGVDIEKQILPLLGTDFTFALIGLDPGLLVPSPRAVFVAGSTSPAALQAVLGAASHPSQTPGAGITHSAKNNDDSRLQAPTPLGPLELTVKNGALWTALGNGAMRSCEEAGSGRQPSLRQSRHWRTLDLSETAANASLLAYADFPAVREALGAALASSALWDEDSRADLILAQKIVGSLTDFGAVALVATPSSDSLVLRLSAPLY